MSEINIVLTKQEKEAYWVIKERLHLWDGEKPLYMHEIYEWVFNKDVSVYNVARIIRYIQQNSVAPILQDVKDGEVIFKVSYKKEDIIREMERMQEEVAQITKAMLGLRFLITEKVDGLNQFVIPDNHGFRTHPLTTRQAYEVLNGDIVYIEELKNTYIRVGDGYVATKEGVSDETDESTKGYSKRVKFNAHMDEHETQQGPLFPAETFNGKPIHWAKTTDGPVWYYEEDMESLKTSVIK